MPTILSKIQESSFEAQTAAANLGPISPAVPAAEGFVVCWPLQQWPSPSALGACLLALCGLPELQC